LIQYLVYRELNKLPQRAGGAIDRIGAKFHGAGMEAAECGVKKRASQCFQHIVDDDFVSGLRQHISSFVAGSAVDKTLYPQYPGELGHIMAAQPLRFAESRNTDAGGVVTAGNAY